jgi:polysaccharide export outer membrane protein
MKLFRSVAFIAMSLYFFSCTPQKKIPNYLESVSDTTVNKEVKTSLLRIQKNDLLSIQIYSTSTDPSIDLQYNLPSINSNTGGAVTGGVLVDANGNIDYPKLGSFHAEGLTKEELAAEFKKRLTQPIELLRNPTVIIRFVNLRITVLGEVNNQGVVSIPGERVTILEAIGLAGGINDYGLKDAVRVVRETNGKRETGVVDLSAKKLFESPYYTLEQNDVIFVDPTNKKRKKADQDAALQRIGLGLSLITTIALLYNIFK